MLDNARNDRVVNEGRGRPRIRPALEERIIQRAIRYPCRGVRKISRDLGTSHLTVYNVLRRSGLRCYKVQNVYALEPGDHKKRRKFCRWALRMLYRNPNFFHRIIFTDEAGCSSGGTHNPQNVRIWSLRNPHAMLPSKQQGRFNVNTWCGIYNKR